MKAVRSIRSFSSARQVVLTKNTASPLEAFEVKSMDTSKLSAAQGLVHVKLVSSVIGESDVHAMRSDSGSVGSAVGKQGLLEVVDGAGSNFSKGDKVVSVNATTGLWQSELLLPAAELTQVPSTVADAEVADFIALAKCVSMMGNSKAGDVVVVTGAESPLGVATAVVGKKKSLKVVAVVGGSLDVPKTMDRLKEAGASIVAAEDFDEGSSYVVSHAFRRLLSDYPATKVAIEGRGGLYAHEVARTLGEHGRMYVVGGGPITLPTSLFLERGITVTSCPPLSKESCEEAAAMLKEMPSSLKSPVVEFGMDEIGKAVDSVGLGPASILKA